MLLTYVSNKRKEKQNIHHIGVFNSLDKNMILRDRKKMEISITLISLTKIMTKELSLVVVVK